MELTHTQTVQHLKNGFQVVFHWSDDNSHVFSDVISLAGEAYRLLYTYLEHNSYETLILFPDGSRGKSFQPMSVNKTGMSMVLQDVFHGWMEADWPSRERMIGVALTLINSDAQSQYFCKTYYKELGRRRNHG